MTISNSSPSIDILERLSEDATYSAQAYFEAAKSTEFWGRTVVFFPALVAALAGVISSLYSVKIGGPISAISGAVAATASFIGSSKRTASYLDSARQYTNLRHAARLEISLAHSRDEAELEGIVRDLSSKRATIVSNDEPIPNRHFDRASRRIEAGVTSYAQDE